MVNSENLKQMIYKIKQKFENTIPEVAVYDPFAFIYGRRKLKEIIKSIKEELCNELSLDSLLKVETTEIEDLEGRKSVGRKETLYADERPYVIEIVYTLKRRVTIEDEEINLIKNVIRSYFNKVINDESKKLFNRWWLYYVGSIEYKKEGNKLVFKVNLYGDKEKAMKFAEVINKLSKEK